MGWFVVIVHVSAAIGALIFGVYSIHVHKIRSVFKRLKRHLAQASFDQWMFIFAAGLCSTLYNLCFLYAMVLTSKAGVAVIIETSPVIAMFLTSAIVQKTWQNVGLKHALVSLVILMGVICIVIADQQDIGLMTTDFSAYMKTQDYVSLVGCGVALLGSIMSALSDLMRAQVGNIVRHIIPKDAVRYDRDLSGIMFGEAIVRLTAIPMALVVLMIFSDVSTFSVSDAVYAFFAGFIIFNIGSITYAAALLKSHNPAIALLDYLSPPLSIVMLVMLGLSDLHPFVILGTILIIIGNAFFVFERAENKEHINHP